jgi:hypothetical protein
MFWAPQVLWETLKLHRIFNFECLQGQGESVNTSLSFQHQMQGKDVKFKSPS